MMTSAVAFALAVDESKVERERNEPAVAGGFLFPRLGALVVALIAILCVALTGCGGGGYPGGGLTGISASSIVMDAGQSVPITATLAGNIPVSWSLSGPSCTGASCGMMSASSGTSVTYTAPSGITSQMQSVLLAKIAGTNSQKTVNITVNPDPAFNGTPPSGTVGNTYTATITASGGTDPLTTTVSSGSLPPGLTHNPTSGVISGTPTATGTYTFALQATDESVTPFKATANESITVLNPASPLTLIGGPQPTGEVGVAYTTSLIASGGVTPYSWIIIGGALPGGLSISPTTGALKHCWGPMERPGHRYAKSRVTAAEY